MPKKPEVPKWSKVWNRPELLKPEDWSLVTQVIPILQNADVDAFQELVRDRTENSLHELRGRTLFYRIFGWPEGYSYCYGRDSRRYVELTAMPAMTHHFLPHLLTMEIPNVAD